MLLKRALNRTVLSAATPLRRAFSGLIQNWCGVNAIHFCPLDCLPYSLKAGHPLSVTGLPAFPRLFMFLVFSVLSNFVWVARSSYMQALSLVCVDCMLFNEDVIVWLKDKCMSVSIDT